LRIRLPGYARFSFPAGHAVALERCKPSLERILEHETIYEFAARQSGARIFEGRAPVYAVDLDDECGSVVVRRSMRGGALARLNTDRFLPPTRGLRELIASLHLRTAGVSTPEVVAVIVYRAGIVFRRSDVITRELQDGADLASLLSESDGDSTREAALENAAALVAALSRAGAHHPDLNLKNIFMTGMNSADQNASRAHILDIDRIRFHIPGDPMVLQANINRLERSIRKWRDRRGLAIDDIEIQALRARTIDLAG
jgi:tRNA A-37 threonylcarbamoyl transferase component Bud32